MRSVRHTFSRWTQAFGSRFGLVLAGCVALASVIVIAQTAEKKFEDFNPSNFDRSTTIDNEWMPLKPGTRFVYEGTTIEDDGTAVPHRVVINVTDLTKVIGGIRSVVTWDLDYSDGELVEAELAFFAQDNDGNVWRMGEYPEEYEDGKFVAAPTWIHGLKTRGRESDEGQAAAGDAQLLAGMGARGRLDRPWTGGPGGPEDQGRRGAYEDVLVIAETSGAEKDAQQLKYYARERGQHPRRLAAVRGRRPRRRSSWSRSSSSRPRPLPRSARRRWRWRKAPTG